MVFIFVSVHAKFFYLLCKKLKLLLWYLKTTFLIADEDTLKLVKKRLEFHTSELLISYNRLTGFYQSCCKPCLLSITCSLMMVHCTWFIKMELPFSFCHCLLIFLFLSFFLFVCLFVCLSVTYHQQQDKWLVFRLNTWSMYVCLPIYVFKFKLEIVIS